MTSLSDEDYRRLRQAILDELNRRRPARTTAAVDETTTADTEATTAITTEQETTELITTTELVTTEGVEVGSFFLTFIILSTIIANPAGDAGDIPSNILVRGTSIGISPSIITYFRI